MLRWEYETARQSHDSRKACGLLDARQDGRHCQRVKGVVDESAENHDDEMMGGSEGRVSS